MTAHESIGLRRFLVAASVGGCALLAASIFVASRERFRGNDFLFLSFVQRPEWSWVDRLRMMNNWMVRSLYPGKNMRVRFIDFVTPGGKVLCDSCVYFKLRRISARGADREEQAPA